MSLQHREMKIVILQNIPIRHDALLPSFSSSTIPLLLTRLLRPSYFSYLPRVTDPETRYRRALTEYLAAEDEYNELLYAREEAALRARAETLRQERARFLQGRQLEQALTRARVQSLATNATDDLALPHVVPVMCSPPKRRGTSLPDVLASRRPQVHASRTDWKTLLESLYDSISQPSVDEKAQPDHNAKGDEFSASSLESLRERLQKTAGDEEVQDVARAILRRLGEPTHTTGVIEPSPAASSLEVRVCIAQPSEGADLYRSDALQGVAAEAAKASFKAHRATTAGQDVSSNSPPAPKTASSSLATIQDIRSTLTKLSGGFSLPPLLEFADDEADGLAYSPTNAPVRLYEHALDELLVQLDAVESDGDEEVREVRRAAVKEVEKAIEDVERRVKEARQIATEGTRHGVEVPVAASESEIALSQDEVLVARSESAVDKKPQEDGPSPSKSDDNLSPASLSVPDSEVAPPHGITSAEPAQDTDGLHEDAVILVSPPEAVSAPTPSPTADGEVSCVCTDDVSESPHEMAPERASTAPPERSPSTTPLESPVEVAIPIVGAIAPSSTPVYPALPSSILLEELSASLSYDRLSASPRPEGDDDEWTEVEA
ncbi:hypothetical protein BJV78DRAFT_684790 [Lactifluus subvellereus]|nr:hypothetical protein BJV78DRAFT_684790 [Lactifluus subvellereus]